jgi:hypothetical protein
MGFLDKLLGRGKDAAQDVGDKAQDVGEKTKDVASDAGDKAKEGFDDAKSHVSGEDDLSDTGQAEQRLDNVRDQALRDEGRMP